MSTFDVMMDVKQGASTDEAVVSLVHYLAVYNPEVKEEEAFAALVEVLRKKYPQYEHILNICCADVAYTGVYIKD